MEMAFEDQTYGNTTFGSYEYSNEIFSSSESSQLAQADWMGACTTIQQVLHQPCESYVNSDGTLTSEGERAVKCITNGAVLAGGGLSFGLPSTSRPCYPH
jgi:hypothetical protein